MRRLIRSPLTWLVAAEILVVGALVVVAWNVVASTSRQVAASPALAPPMTPTDATPPSLPGLAAPALKRRLGPWPGLNVDVAFWRERLAQLNSDQVDLERLEWGIVHGAEDAVKHYLETVVLPAIRRAEREGGAGPGLTLLR